jgi:hypothetical protein
MAIMAPSGGPLSARLQGESRRVRGSVPFGGSNGLVWPACRTPGPAIVADRGTGWLVPPDDEEALVDVLLSAARGEEERRARGRRGQTESRGYGWAEIAPRFASLYEELLAFSPRQQVARLSGGGSRRVKSTSC